MKNLAVLAGLLIACALMTTSISSADEIVVTPEQWNKATAPPSPGSWQHVGTTGDTGEPATGEQVKKEKARETVTPVGKEIPATKGAGEAREASGAAKTGEASPAKGAAAAPEAKAPETAAPQYRIFNLNLPEEPKAQPAPANPAAGQPAPAPAPAQPPAPSQTPGNMEKGGMIIPSAGSASRMVTVTPEK